MQLLEKVSVHHSQFANCEYGALKSPKTRQKAAFDESAKEVYGRGMCRNIKPLFNFEPPVTADEVQAASLQFVRKITGFHHPSKANEKIFQTAVDEIAHLASHLLHDLKPVAPPKDRAEEAAKAKARSAQRFGR